MGNLTGARKLGWGAFLYLSPLIFAFPAPAATLLRGPYLQLCTPTGILVRWRTDEPTDSRVRYGSTPTSLDLSADDPATTTEHQVTLSGLQPKTRYYYSVGAAAGVLAENQNFFFDTLPPPGQSRPTRIWFVSDYGFGDDSEMAVRDSYLNFALAHGPAQVWLTGGDNDQLYGDDSDLQISLFDIYSALLENLPIWPSLGNHDTYTESVPGPYPYFDNFTLPTQGEAGGTPSGSEHYYSFDYGDIHFVTLDSIDPSLSASAASPMLQWLQQDLAATTRRWKIAFWHGPPYTKGSHDSDDPTDTLAQMIQMRENALPIIEAAGVDLVLCGHSHVYERSYLLYGHYGYSSTFSETNKINSGNGRADGDGPYRQVDGKGAVYVVAGVGGHPYGFSFGSHPAHLVKLGTERGSCVVDISGDRLDFQFINDQTQRLDYFTILKGPALRILTWKLSTNSISFTWNTVPRQLYQVVQARALAGPWFPASAPILAGSLLTSWSSNLPRGVPQSFYRLDQLPDPAFVSRPAAPASR